MARGVEREQQDKNFRWKQIDYFVAWHLIWISEEVWELLPLPIFSSAQVSLFRYLELFSPSEQPSSGNSDPGYRSPDASFGDFSCLKFAYDPWLSFYVILISLHPSDVSHRQLSQFYFFFIWLSGMLTPNSLWKIGGSWGEILLSSNLGHSTSWQLHELGHFEPRLKKLSVEVPMTGTDEWSSIEASLAIKFWPIVRFPSLWGETFTSISFLSYTCLKNPAYLQS